MIEFGKYEKWGAYHWKEFKKDTAYRKNVLKIKDWVGSGVTLDVGAGDGLITSIIGAIGIDNNKKAIELAKEKKVEVIQGDVYDIPFQSGYFDNVLMADVIEHLEFPDKGLLEVKSVLKDNGLLYIVTPPKGGKKDKYHYKEYTPDELVELLGELGFSLKGTIEVRDDLRRMYGVFTK